MPKWFLTLVLIMASLSLIPITMVYLKRSNTTPEPRVSIIPDMDNQPRWKTQMYYPLFEDKRVSRPPVDGTVARGMLNSDSHFNYGIVNGAWASDFPANVVVDEALLERGEREYGIYCAMCHGYDGYGKGVVAQRVTQISTDMQKSGLGITWVAPLDYHSDVMRSRPVGHIFNTITNGARTMPAYGAQIPVGDRWAIVAYVRALQLSQHATLDLVPSGERSSLLSSRPAAMSAETEVSDEPVAADTTPEAASEEAPAVDSAAAETSSEATAPAEQSEGGTE